MQEDLTPQFSIPLDNRFGKLLVSDVKVVKTTQFSKKKRPCRLPASFWKLIAVHAVNALEKTTVALKPAIGVATKKVCSACASCVDVQNVF